MTSDPTPDKGLTPIRVPLSTPPVSAAPATPSPTPPSAASVAPKAATASPTAPAARFVAGKTAPTVIAGKPTTEAAGKASRSPRVVRTVGERVERFVLSLPVLWALGLSSAALMVWVLVARLPQTFERRLVSARETLTQTEAAAAEAAQHETVDLNTLSNQVATAEHFLIARKDDVLPLLSEIGRMAKASGFLSDVGSGLSSEHTPGVPRVKVLSTVLRLQSMPTQTTNGSAFYPRLVSFLDKLEQLTNKVEVSGFSAACDKPASGSAQVELQFWVRDNHDKDPGK